MPEIVQLPAGLTGLLGLRAGGATPRDLLYQVAPTVDLGQLYVNNQIEHGFALFTPALGFRVQDALTLPGEVNLLVPPGEYWFVEHLSLRLNPAAGISYRGQIVMREDPAQWVALSPMWQEFDPANGPAVGNPQHVVVPASRPFWATPRCLIGANFDRITGVPGAGTALMTLRFARFRT